MRIRNFLLLMGKDLKSVYSPQHDRRDERATDGYVVEFVPELHATF